MGSSASRGRAGAWFMALITSMSFICMSVPTWNDSVVMLMPARTEELILSSPTIVSRTSSCGSTSSASISAGAAARQKLRMVILGRSRLGVSCTGRLSNAIIPMMLTMRKTTTVATGLA